MSFSVSFGKGPCWQRSSAVATDKMRRMIKELKGMRSTESDTRLFLLTCLLSSLFDGYCWRLEGIFNLLLQDLGVSVADILSVIFYRKEMWYRKLGWMIIFQVSNPLLLPIFYLSRSTSLFFVPFSPFLLHCVCSCPILTIFGTLLPCLRCNLRCCDGRC